MSIETRQMKRIMAEAVMPAIIPTEGLRGLLAVDAVGIGASVMACAANVHDGVFGDRVVCVAKVVGKFELIVLIGVGINVICTEWSDVSIDH